MFFATGLAWAGLAPGHAGAAEDTFEVVETWSVTLAYRDWGGGFTGTRLFSGRETGRVTVRDRTYLLANRVGHHLVGVDPTLTKRAIVPNGDGYSIYGSNVFAPVLGATTHAIVFLGAFMLSVPLVDGG